MANLLPIAATSQRPTPTEFQRNKKKTTCGFTWALDPGREAMEVSGKLSFKKPEEWSGRPESVREDISGTGVMNYSISHAQYKGDMTKHTRTRRGPAELHNLPRTQAQEYGFLTQKQQRFAPANGGPYYPRNPSNETKIADQLAKGN